MGCGISRFVPRQDQGRNAPQLCTRSGEYDHDHDHDDDDDDNNNNNPSTITTKKNNAHLPSDADHISSSSYHTPQLQPSSPNNNNDNNSNIVQRRKQSAEAASHHYNDNDGPSGSTFMGSPSFREYCVPGDTNHRKEMMSEEKGKRMMQREDSNI